MNNNFQHGRFIFSDNKWYVCMRPGDEKHKTFCGFRAIRFFIMNNQPIAGPFISKKSMLNWLEGFISFYGTKRDLPLNYISDDLVRTLHG